MIVKILGLLDIFSAVIFWLSALFNFIPDSFILLAGFYLIAKGVVFLISKDIASIIDVICGVLILVSANMVLPFIIVSIISLFLIQKGIFSIVAYG